MLRHFRDFSGSIYENPKVRVAVDDGRSGVLVSPDSVDELERAIAALLRDPALAASHADNLRRVAEARFPWRQAADKYAALYAPDGPAT